MYCKNCGKQIEATNNGLCSDCESLLNTTVVNTDEKFEVVEEVKNNTNNNTNTNSTNYSSSNENYTQANTYYSSQDQKSKTAAGIFGILLGALGVHNFYLGYTGKAIAQLLITILSCGALSFVSAIWGLIEGIMILTGSISQDANGVALKE